jgi:hypothetical protein
MKGFREIGATLQYTYRDLAGATVMDFVIAPNDCRTNGSILAAASEVNATAPKNLDEHTRLDGATAEGLLLQYLYTLPTYDPSSVDPDSLAALRADMKERLTRNVCEKDEFAWLRKLGGTAQFTYRDTSRGVVISVVVPPERCRSR